MTQLRCWIEDVLRTPNSLEGIWAETEKVIGPRLPARMMRRIRFSPQPSPVVRAWAEFGATTTRCIWLNHRAGLRSSRKLRLYWKWIPLVFYFALSRHIVQTNAITRQRLSPLWCHTTYQSSIFGDFKEATLFTQTSFGQVNRKMHCDPTIAYCIAS